MLPVYKERRTRRVQEPFSMIKKIEREIDDAKKDLAILNVDYLKKKAQIEEYLYDKEMEILKLAEDVRASRQYML